MWWGTFLTMHRALSVTVGMVDHGDIGVRFCGDGKYFYGIIVQRYGDWSRGAGVAHKAVIEFQQISVM